MILVSALVALTTGLGQVSLSKDVRLEFGTSVREVRGSHEGFRLHAPLPLWEARIKKSFNEQLDGFVGIALNRGAIGAEHPVLRGQAVGDFGSLSLGLDYYPDRRRLLGFELAGETLFSRYEMRGGFGPCRQRTPDELFGVGTSIGLVGEIPLPFGENHRYRLVWGSGYNFTLTSHHRAASDLSGWYGRIAIHIDLGNGSRKEKSYGCR
jgi:hypothetical protein